MRIKNGFTLIELLVVVLIIGILAAVAVPRYQGAVFDSKMKEAEIMLKAIYEAKKLCLLRTGGEGCTTFDELDIGLPPSCVPDPGNESVGWTDRHRCKNFYITPGPSNIITSTVYLYFSGSNYKHFSMKDGQFICREPLDAGTLHAAYCKRMGYRESF